LDGNHTLFSEQKRHSLSLSIGEKNKKLSRTITSSVTTNHQRHRNESCHTIKNQTVKPNCVFLFLPSIDFGERSLGILAVLEDDKGEQGRDFREPHRLGQRSEPTELLVYVGLTHISAQVGHVQTCRLFAIPAVGRRRAT
jgi:hypothetical protein